MRTDRWRVLFFTCISVRDVAGLGVVSVPRSIKPALRTKTAIISKVAFSLLTNDDGFKVEFERSE